MKDIIFGNLKYEEHPAWEGYVINIYPNTIFFKNLILLNIEPRYPHNLIKFMDIHQNNYIYISTPINPIDVISIQTPLDYTTIQNKHISEVTCLISSPMLNHLEHATIELFKPI